jgi:hypothetical protein
VRLALASALCLLVLGASSAAAGPAPLSVTILGVEPHAHAAYVRYRVSAPARVAAESAQVEGYGAWSRTVGPRQGGRVLLGALEPGSTYSLHVVARAGQQRAEAWGSFTAQPIRNFTSATTRPTALLLNGQPFFPRMVWKQCRPYDASLAAGVNVFMGAACGNGGDLVNSLRGRAYAIVSVQERRVHGRGLIGWHQPDEPDLGDPRGGVLEVPPSRETGRVTFMTLNNHFFSASSPGPGGREVYPGLIARAEMVGFDLYPLQSWCRRDAYQAVFEAQHELALLAQGKPTFQWIEAARMERCRGFDPTPATVRAEAWLAIAGGARGLGWFPFYWKPEVAAEIARISKETASLAPALLADELPVVADSASPVKVGARTLNGATYVIAVNSTTRPATASFTVPGLRALSVRDVTSGRVLPVGAGRISDTFSPLGVRIYVAPPPVAA